MMYAELYQYLIQHKELPVPGIGTFLLQRNSAVVDFPGKQIHPPSYAVVMQQGSHLPDKNFFSWLSHTFGITDREAMFKFNDFALNLKKQIAEGDVINWNAVGTLSKGLGGDVKFLSADASSIFGNSIPAEKVIRQKAEHMVRVGEDQKTSAEMEVMLSKLDEKKSYWWVIALAVTVLSLVFIGWYLSQHGIDVSAAANSSKAKVEEASNHYSILP